MDQGAPGIVEIVVGDEPSAWVAAGFVVDGDACRVGTVTLRLTGEAAGGRGIRSWTLAGVHVDRPDAIDGVVTSVTEPRPAADSSRHPNGATSIDHVVLATPDLPRTVGALEAIGLDLRRTRDADNAGSPMRQAFFRLGEVVLEVVGPPEAASGGPAKWYGLAFSVADLDGLTAALGSHLGAVKPAVQAGRRITTLRHRELGLSVAVAFMDDPAVP